MARPREFDKADALMQATKVFWTHGYNATSLADLTKAMGISKSSFYDTFGSKHDLYMAAIDFYIETSAEKSLAVLIEDGAPLDLLDQWLQQGIDSLVDGDIRRGCFLNNCAVEDSPHDPDVAAKVRQALYDIKQKLAAVIACGQVSGEVNRNQHAEAYASFLLNTNHGLWALGKCDPDPVELASIKNVALASLQP